MLGKRLINSNSAAAGGSCTTDTLQILGDTSCVAYYKMSDATDESGNFDGTPTSVNFNVAGKFGNAGSFNGSSSVIVLPTSLPTAFGANNFTISYWINLSSRSASNEDVHFSIQDPYFFYTYSNISSGNIEFTIRTGGAYSTVDTGDVLPLNSWNNIVFVKSSSGNGVSIYLNGTEIYTTTSYTGNLDSGQSGVNNIGTYGNSALYAISGKIDQVRIFNKALSSSEVTTLYNEVQCVPTIVPTNFFNTVLYPGNDGTNPRTDVNFKPDFIWLKNRETGVSHCLFDSIRGAGTTNQLYSDDTKAEGQDTTLTNLVSFDTSGFTLGATTGFNVSNKSTDDYVAWNWKAGGAAVAATSIEATSATRSANADAGFSIIKFQSSTSGSAVMNYIEHGLDAAPEMVFYKRTNISQNWLVQNSYIQQGQTLQLNLTNAASPNNATSFFDNTSTSIGVRSNWAINANQPYIAYCFHSVDGMSRVGSYQGDNSTNESNVIVTGFRPAFVMIKNTTTGSTSWVMADNRRGYADLYANDASAEFASGSALGAHFLSNGFTFATADISRNASNNTYIFLAIAEEVFTPITRNATNPFGDASELALYKLESDGTDSEGNYTTTTLPNVTFATGYIGNAAVFNGNNSNIKLPDNIGTPFSTASAFAISAWINLSASGTNYNGRRFIYFIGKKYLYLEVRANNTLNGVVVQSNSQVLQIQPTTTLSSNVWYNVVFTGDSNGGNIYLNGTSIGNGSWDGTFNSTALDNSIGCENPASSALRFQGKIDQVRIFNKSLDDGEVMALYLE